jgi:enoyl-CoA hydratase
MSAILVHDDGAVRVLTIDRPDRRNAVDEATASELLSAVLAADTDPSVSVIVLTGAGKAFCAGADLQALSAAEPKPITAQGPGPMGPTRVRLSKPSIAAVEGPAVAGGLELALWCDLRVVAEDATLGVFCRRWGVPLVDLGTIRLPRLIGQSRAMDLVLTGRGIDGVEAERLGLANRVVAPGHALEEAVRLGHELAGLPQACLRNDRLSVIEQWDLDEPAAIANEVRHGVESLRSSDVLEGLARFAGGAGRHGQSAAADS